MQRLRSRFNLGGVDPSAPLSPQYGESRFDSLTGSLRSHFGDSGPIAHRTAAPAQRKKPGRSGQVSALVPFAAAAHEHTEPFFDSTYTLGTNTQQVGPIDVPSYGFIRHIYVLVTTSGGVAGSGVLHEDSPFRLFDSITLSDVNGAPIFGPLTGFQAFLANLFGGYAFNQDPRIAPDYSAGVVTFSFGLRIPVEIHHNNGLGALANQNSAASYKLAMTLNTLANFYSVTTGVTTPNVRIRCFLEAWSLPDKADRAGRPQAQLPPLHGTTQFWSQSQQPGIATGRGTAKVTRMGNLLRTIILVARSAGARTTADFPEVMELWWDNRQLLMEHRNYRRQRMAEQVVTSSAGIPAGVEAYSFDTDVLGHAGDGTPELWIPTTQATRFEFQGTWDATDLDILVNDVAPVETDQARRYVEDSATGFEPAI